ncbi:TRIC cation channel family protein [Vagococcus sp. DIV0080]|uniref:TRIC cation channel family protein n=1 Tax=Candidatus Vagococcus giribetii TaxID=2230876 RepID=A0ABS3HVQ4_9ENTE|nr:TRIC cation channel family protein [Vagococcus sp. DIV0080]MBO0477834.1 TRIC cation channel family protein [Vagococcus sp. DIV0080]
MDTWDIFAIIGTVSFALQGGLIAMEKKYDLFAVYLFGLLTSFGGGALQHVLIGGSDYQLWNQERLFLVAMISITVVILFPKPE